MTRKRTRPELEQLRKLIEASDPSTPQADTAIRLARTLLGEPAHDLSCADVQAQLPEYVAAELRHAPVARLFPGMTEHLLTCQDCGDMHADLLDLELGIAQLPLPAPDVARLQRQLAERELRGFVLKVAEHLTKLLYPDELIYLSSLADAFFDQVAALPRRLVLQSTSSQALGFSGGDLPDTLRVLAATYSATRQLEDEMMADRRRELQAQGRLGQVVQDVARQSATDLGIKGLKGQQFVVGYQQMVLSSVMTFPTPITVRGEDD